MGVLRLTLSFVGESISKSFLSAAILLLRVNPHVSVEIP